MQDWKIPIH